VKRRSFALDGLDLKLAKFLNFRGGFFVEAGANDGVSQSNTLYFEKYLRWNGLLIEPVPQLASRCRQNRPRCAVESVALSSFADSDRPFLEMRYCNLMSVVKGALKTEEAEQEHVEVGCDCQALETYELKVPVSTLSDVFERHGVGHIDLLSLDVEGYEAEALKGLDLDRHCPRWMLIETRFRDDVEACISPHYEPVAELSHWDVLYRCKAA